MLKIAFVGILLSGGGVATWRALRRPDEPADEPCDGYMRNIRASTGDFGFRPLPTGDMDPMKAPIFPPTGRSSGRQNT